MIGSLLLSLRLFSVFWLILTMLYVEWSSISYSARPFTKPLQVQKITICIAVIFLINSIFSSLARSNYLFLFSFSLIFPLWSTRITKSTRRQVFWDLFFFFWGWVLSKTARSGLLARIRGFLFYLKIPDYYYYYSLIRAFHISVSRWFFTGI